MIEQLQYIFDAIINGEAGDVSVGVQTALDSGIPADDILKQGLIPAMKEVGAKFESGEFFVPEMLISARAMQTGLGLLKPILATAEIKSSGKIVIGTVEGDLHDIGKNLVVMMLEGAGFEMIDLGSDVVPEKFVEAVRANQPDIVAMSALLTTTMPSMKSTITALKTAGLRDKVKIIIGGAPVSEDYAGEIGADGYASDASRAANLAQELCSP